MGRYPKLRCSNLYTGVIRYQEGHTFSCFFIVEHTDDKEYIQKHALELMVAGCCDFHFYGRYAGLWDAVFDAVDIHRIQHGDDWNSTRAWDDLNSFVDTLRFEVSSRTFIPHDVYLIYDDEAVKEQVLSILNSIG